MGFGTITNREHLINRWELIKGVLLQTTWRSPSFWGGIHLTTNDTGKEIKVVAITVVSSGYQQDGGGLIQGVLKLDFIDGTFYEKTLFQFSSNNWNRTDVITIPTEHQNKLLKSFQVTYGGKIVVQNSTTSITEWYEET